MDGFEGFDLDRAIEERAAAAGIVLPPGVGAGLAGHAGAVMENNTRLHLTSITEPRAFVERHLGEAFEGASLLQPDLSGTLLDLGSGNGYPGLPLAAARPGLRAVLVEASRKKAAFLRGLGTIDALAPFTVLERQIQRGGDLDDLSPIKVVSARAVGGWERIIPKLASAMEADGHFMLWAGSRVERVARYAAWRRLRLEKRHRLPGRGRSWVWLFGLNR